jgi:hypothetical protein
MSYDSWKTTDPRDSEPDYDTREELDDWDRADLDEAEIEFLDERADERAEDEADKRADTFRRGVAALREAKFWQHVNALALEFPEFRIEVV